MKSKKWFAAIAVTCCVLLAGSSVGAIAYAQNTDGTSAASGSCSAVSLTGGDSSKNSKEETVYVLSGADGATNNIIVSDWLKNPEGLSTLNDKSDLSDITNIKGDEAFTSGSDGQLTWAAEGKDIYYRGTSTKSLPVDLSIRYQLDGKDISAEELAGKSGKVSITYNYKNNVSKTVTVNGKTMTVSVPFVAVTGILLDGDKFTNISVSNGKVINDGNRSIVMGFALPGLQKSLDLTDDQLDLPDSVTLTADVTDFELDTSLTFVSNDLLNDLNLDDTDSLDDLDAAVTKLTDAMTQLMDGSSQLYNGLDTLLTKSHELVAGVNTLYKGAQALVAGAAKVAGGAAKVDAGAQTLSAGTDALSSGANDLSAGTGKLVTGVNALSAGLAKLVSNNAELLTGANQVFSTMLSTANTQLQAAGINVTMTKDNYEATLNKVIASQLGGAQSQLQSAGLLPGDVALTAENYKAVLQNVQTSVGKLTDLSGQQFDQARNAVLLTVALGNLKKSGSCPSVNYMTAEEYTAAAKAGRVEQNVMQTVQGTVQQVAAAYAADANTKAAVDAGIRQALQATVQKAIDGLDTLCGLKAQLLAYDKQFNAGLKAYTAGVSTIDGQVASELKPGAAELNSGVQKLKDKMPELLQGVSALCAGATELSTGADTLSKGMQTLYDGVAELQQKSSALPDGVSQLKDGAMQLSDGLKQLNDEGISKLTDLYQNNIKDLLDRLRAMKEVSQEYTSFSGSADGMKSSVKFVYRTDSILIPDDDENSDTSASSQK